MDVAERRATSDLTRRRRDYSSRVKLFYWLVSYKDASCLAPRPCFLALCSICGAPLIVVVAERHTFKTLKPQRYPFSCTETQARISGRLVLSVVHRSRRRCRKSSI